MSTDDITELLRRSLQEIAQLEGSEPLNAETSSLLQYLNLQFRARTDPAVAHGLHVAWRAFVTARVVTPLVETTAWTLVDHEPAATDGTATAPEFRLSLPSVIVRVLFPDRSWHELMTTTLFRPDGVTRLRSFRHHVGINKVLTWNSVPRLLAYLRTIAEVGPCEDPVHVAPPCQPQAPIDLTSDIQDPVLRRLAEAKSRDSTHFGSEPQVWFGRFLPPYAPSTVAAFEAANGMAFPEDLVWFLTHVSRELLPGHVIHLCEPDVEVDAVGDADDPECVNDLVEMLDGPMSSRKKIAREHFALQTRGDTDSGRVLVRLNPDSSPWTPSPYFHLFHEALDDMVADEDSAETYGPLCAHIREQVIAEGICVDVPGLRQARDNSASGGEDEDDEGEDEDAFWDEHDRHERGVMWLANFGCSCDVKLVVGGPFAGAVTYMYQVRYKETRVVFPTFRSFVAVVINGGYEWTHTYHPDALTDSVVE